MPLKLRHLADFLLAGTPCLLAMCQKQKGLATNSENRAKSYVIESNTVISSLATMPRKNAGAKNEG
jgi:hypothetical protein